MTSSQTTYRHTNGTSSTSTIEYLHSYRPEVTSVRVTRGIAGQLAVSGYVSYSAEDRPTAWTFAGSVYGGPVAYVLSLSDGREVQGFVSDPSRFGDFATDPRAWTLRYYA